MQSSFFIIPYPLWINYLNYILKYSTICISIRHSYQKPELINPQPLSDRSDIFIFRFTCLPLIGIQIKNPRA